MKKITITLFLISGLLITSLTLSSQVNPVYAVIFTHIEDNTPAGTIGSAQNKQIYFNTRNRLIQMALLMQQYQIKWSFQPDWKILLAALQYEDSTLIQSTNNKNFLRYFKEDLQVAIDPHSHESMGYNYTDVAHLLDSLGVGGSKVIGGHIWDPSLPQFAEWDRFRIPVLGNKYPWAVWQGTILTGSGTPNHVNDPEISGIWRPKDRDHYFIDDPSGNMYAIGKYKEEFTTINELIDVANDPKTDSLCMLTMTFHVNLAAMSAVNGFHNIENNLLRPLDSLRTLKKAELTDFTSLIDIWKNDYLSNACIYDPTVITSVTKVEFNNKISLIPNPVHTEIQIISDEVFSFFKIYNSNQQLIYSGEDISEINISSLKPGLYLIQLANNLNTRCVKFIKD